MLDLIVSRSRFATGNGALRASLSGAVRSTGSTWFYQSQELVAPGTIAEASPPKNFSPMKCWKYGS
jgi:hypothetical protein